MECMRQNWVSSLEKMEQWIVGPDTRGRYDSSLWPVQDIQYLSRERRAEQIEYLPHPSDDYKYLGEWGLLG